MTNELIGIISNEGELKGVIEDDSFNVIVQITESGPRGPQGKSLEFHWNGTQLGIRIEGETTYQYVNLKGEQGEQGPYTPIRGTDYWTEADQTAIVADVLAALPNGDGVSY